MINNCFQVNVLKEQVLFSSVVNLKSSSHNTGSTFFENSPSDSANLNNCNIRWFPQDAKVFLSEKIESLSQARQKRSTEETFKNFLTLSQMLSPTGTLTIVSVSEVEDRRRHDSQKLTTETLHSKRVQRQGMLRHIYWGGKPGQEWSISVSILCFDNKKIRLEVQSFKSLRLTFGDSQKLMLAKSFNMAHSRKFMFAKCKNFANFPLFLSAKYRKLRHSERSAGIIYESHFCNAVFIRNEGPKWRKQGIQSITQSNL